MASLVFSDGNVPNRNFNIFTINNLTSRHFAKPRNVVGNFGNEKPKIKLNKSND